MSKDNFIILVVDDEEGILEGLGKILSLGGYSVVTASTGMQAIKIMSNKKIDLAFVDLKLTDIDGIEIVKNIQPSDIPIVIMTAFASVETAVSSMKIGVVDYIKKPFNNEDIISIADRFYLKKNTESSALRNRSSDLSGSGFTNIILKSKKTREAFNIVEKIKDYNIPILLLGESGTGKEVFARLIHESSKRNNEPFIGINCSAIPCELLESEFFGYDKGAFSGAEKCKPGKFEIAKGGTLFLDEIGDMDLKLQAKLLRVLEERTFEHIGGLSSISFDARVIASTNRNLRQLVKNKDFRSDLYFRLQGLEISLAPLRERKEDLEELIYYFVKLFVDNYGKNVSISLEAVNYLKEYNWPGNIRELKNIVESAIILADDNSLLLPDNFRIEMLQEESEDDLLLDEAEKEYIVMTLEKNRFNRTLAAKDLKISRKTLYNKIKKFSID